MVFLNLLWSTDIKEILPQTIRKVYKVWAEGKTKAFVTSFPLTRIATKLLSLP